jgi:hypothetical protein
VPHVVGIGCFPAPGDFTRAAESLHVRHTSADHRENRHTSSGPGRHHGMARTAGAAWRHCDDSRVSSSTLSAAALGWESLPMVRDRRAGPFRAPHGPLETRRATPCNRQRPLSAPGPRVRRHSGPRSRGRRVRAPESTQASVHSVRSGAGPKRPDAPCGRPGATGATSHRALHLAPPSRHDEGAGRRMIPPTRPFAETVDRSRLSLTRVGRVPSQWLSERGRPGRARTRGR